MQIFNESTKDLWLPLALGVCLVCLSQAIHADGFGADPRDDNPATKISQGIATPPTFLEADKNSDHYVTKKELEGYPFLLKQFDKVDAGKDGRLKDHEYENLLVKKDRGKGR
jgi:hypothetical protein